MHTERKFRFSVSDIVWLVSFICLFAFVYSIRGVFGLAGGMAAAFCVGGGTVFLRNFRLKQIVLVFVATFVFTWILSLRNHTLEQPVNALMGLFFSILLTCFFEHWKAKQEGKHSIPDKT